MEIPEIEKTSDRRGGAENLGSCNYESLCGNAQNDKFIHRIGVCCQPGAMVSSDRILTGFQSKDIISEYRVFKTKVSTAQSYILN